MLLLGVVHMPRAIVLILIWGVALAAASWTAMLCLGKGTPQAEIPLLRRTLVLSCAVVWIGVFTWLSLGAGGLIVILNAAPPLVLVKFGWQPPRDTS